MKLIIAGSRTFIDYEKAKLCIQEYLLAHPHLDLVIISGCARGADEMGELYADEFNIKLEQYPADWLTHGNKAGIIRNTEMAKVGTHLLCFWDGKSAGTKHMLETAAEYGIKPWVIMIGEKYE